MSEVLISVAIAIALCQSVKVTVRSLERKKLSIHAFLENGGMPSGHSTLVSSLAMIVGLTEGFDSPLFIVTGAFALIVLRDAFGVRHSVDKIRLMLNDVVKKEKVRSKPVLETVGHTIPQVIVGVILGFVVSLAVYVF